MVSIHARALPTANVSIARKALRHASCTTSSASARSPVSHSAVVRASGRWGRTTAENRAFESSSIMRAPYQLGASIVKHDRLPKCDLVHTRLFELIGVLALHTMLLG